MEAQFEDRKWELLKECTVTPELFGDVEARLERFMDPFVNVFVRKEQVAHAHTFVQGLLSDIERKNVESIAYRFGQERMPLQWFIGVSDWDDGPLRDELVRQVAHQLGEPEGVLVFDPSAFPKSGRASVGVARQWCGHLGKVENCQVAVYMGYVSSQEHILVDTRLYLPKEWTQDKERCRRAGIPEDEIRYRSRHHLSLDMLDKYGSLLPHRWITGDDEMGRPYWFRRCLDTRGEQYLLAVPCNTLVRDLEAAPPIYSGRGRKPERPWVRVDKWVASCADDEWVEIDVRDGSKGPLIVELIQRRVVARDKKRQADHEEVLVVIRYKDRDNQNVVKMDYYLSNASPDTPATEFARVAKAEHRIEECIQRARSEAGLADYEVRNWKGWHHHQTLSLVATWFLVTEARRGKKNHASDHCSTDSRRHCRDPSPCQWMRYSDPHGTRTGATSPAKRTRSPVPLETT